MEFPKDHYNHPDLTTEWWYFAGIGELDGKPTNYHVSFFRKFSHHLKKDIYFAHFGLNVNGDYSFREKESDHAKSENSILQVFIDNWDLHRCNNRYVATLDKDIFLTHIAQKRPVEHKAGYYSISDMDVHGTIEGKIFKGRGWFDHEFFNSRSLQLLLSKYLWFALQLEKGLEIMVYIYPKTPANSLGTMIFPDGKTQTISPGEFCLKEKPSGWILELPDYGMEMGLRRKDKLEAIGNLGPDYTEGIFDIVTRKKIGHGFFEIARGVDNG